MHEKIMHINDFIGNPMPNVHSKVIPCVGMKKRVRLKGIYRDKVFYH